MVHKYIRNILVLITITVWIAVFSIDSNLHIIACDVGQGDAILIQKNTTQILIDSGPNNRVLDCLGTHMPFWDKQIELAISTHVDKDHSGGFLDVSHAYKIDRLLVSSSQTDKVLEKVANSTIEPQKDMVIRLGLIYLDILHPYEGFTSKNTNDYSVVNLVRYGNFKAIFMGDLELNISEDLIENSKIGPVDYIKISHHGSKNGTSEKLLDMLRPKEAIISSGKKNSYGHPHKEILQMLNTTNTKILRTDIEGDIDYVTDGINFWYNKQTTHKQ